MKTTNWKIALIAIAIVIAVSMLCVFGVQSAQNKAYGLEESVASAMADVRVQEKRRVD